MPESRNPRRSSSLGGGIADVLQMPVFTALVHALVRSPGIAERLGLSGRLFGESLAIARGGPTVDLATYEAPTVLSIVPVPDDDVAAHGGYYATGIVGAMHGRKKGIHTIPGDDPIWGETGD